VLHGRVFLVSKELPSTSDNPRQPPPEGGDYVFRLDVPKLLEAAKRHGDKHNAAIARRTGIAESSVSRILRGEAQPDLNSAMRFAEQYDLDLRAVIKRVPIEAVA
jgi:transcriptional regulator with XRE-family HTH domain